MAQTIHITVDVEEWFHTNWFDPKLIVEKHYNGKTPKTDVFEKTKELVDLFTNNNVRATFFVLGETAIRYPELIELLKESSHELACHGFYHNKDYNDCREFKSDIKLFKKEISSDVKGFRFPNFDYSPQKLEIIAEEGFIYDSSVMPCLNIPGWYGEHTASLLPYEKEFRNGNVISEFPLSVLPYLRLPGSGGWFLRNIGYWWTKTIIQYSVEKLDYGMIYIHPWEISENNPNFKEIPFHVFRNTGYKTFQNLEKFIKNLSQADFITLDQQLQIRKVEL